MEQSKWGKLISSVGLKDGSTMYAYRRGNMIYFIVNDEIDQSFHIDDVGEIAEAMSGMQNESGI